MYINVALDVCDQGLFPVNKSTNHIVKGEKVLACLTLHIVTLDALIYGISAELESVYTLLYSFVYQVCITDSQSKE